MVSWQCPKYISSITYFFTVHFNQLLILENLSPMVRNVKKSCFISCTLESPRILIRFRRPRPGQNMLWIFRTFHGTWLGGCNDWSSNVDSEDGDIFTFITLSNFQLTSRAAFVLNKCLNLEWIFNNNTYKSNKCSYF